MEIRTVFFAALKMVKGVLAIYHQFESSEQWLKWMC